MSKNKFFKKLLIAGLCALTATAMIGATACKDNPDNGNDDGEEIEDVLEYTVKFDLDGGSWNSGADYSVKVSADGTLPLTLEVPTKDGKVFGGWYNGDKQVIQGVTKIDSDMTLKAKWDEKIEVEIPAVKEVKVNVNDLQTVTEGEGNNAKTLVKSGTSIGEGIQALSDIEVKGTDETVEEEQISYGGTSVDVKKYLSFGGAPTVDNGSVTANALKVTLSEKATIIVYAKSGSTGSARNVRLIDSAGKTKENAPIGDGNIIGTAIFKDLAAGTYYVGSASSTVNFYYIAVVSSINETAVKTYAAEPSTCTKEGTIQYSVTNYGRYLDKDGNAIQNNGIAAPLLDHDFDDDGICKDCGFDSNARVTEISFKTLAASGSSSDWAVGQHFGTDWFELTAVGTSKWATSKEGWSTIGSTVTITVEEASTLKIIYYATTGGRKFTFTKVGETEGTDYEAKTLNGIVEIDLTEGTYTIVFDSNEHKIESISCIVKTDDAEEGDSTEGTDE